MGLFDKLKGVKVDMAATYSTEPNCVYAPVEGKLIPLKEIPDQIFSEGVLGRGCGIEPITGIVAAPFDGKIVQVANTKHAIGIESNDGIELLIHVGIDTVEMNGKGFEPKARIGDVVKAGQVLLNFSIDEIKKAGYDSTTALIVTNSDDYLDVEFAQAGDKKFQDQIMVLKK
jgi:sugar PTS system EIIA component